MKALPESDVWAFDAASKKISRASNVGLFLAALDGHEVYSYLELLEKIAALNYHNSRFRLLFRGQINDYRLDLEGEPAKRSNLYPSILRVVSGKSRKDLLDQCFDDLARAEKLLISRRNIPDFRLRVVRWAILQHYEICETPLLDVTLSLQSALSFAYTPAVSDGYLYVLAVPHLNGPVSTSIESMTQAIDLCQICPPDALRPHFQSGILIGDYPEFLERSQTFNGNGSVENDFSCRLLTKFHLRKIRQWTSEGFTPTPHHLLFPNQRDRWYEELQLVKSELRGKPTR